ncbi:conserved hypothetical protein [[Clostridium] ultunense Esp]|nr:conserved hypothetical protein [[Clostridium] ultunense Esp]
MSMVVVKNLTKVYESGSTPVQAVRNINLTIEPGEFVAVMGPSGCGKSTLLHLVGGLDQPTSGNIYIEGIDLSALSDHKLTELRRRKIGFIFQYFNLIPVLDAVDNTALPLVLDGVAPSVAKKKAVDWLEKLGLKERLHNRPDQLSGGQQQRVAIARALAIEPALILADEPTGNLDSKTGDEVIALIRRISTDWGRTVLMVTHDSRMAAYADRIVFLKDGSIVDETRLSGNERNGEEKSELIRERVDRI